MRISTEPNAKQGTRPTPRTGGHMTKWTRLLAITSVLALALAACSSDSSSGKSSSDTKASTTTTKAKAAASNLPGCQPEPTDKPSKQLESVDPCTGLTDGQMVKVSVANFTAGKTVGINECSSETDDTGSGCDLEGLQTMTIGADGTASASFPVKKGPFGKDNVVCNPPTQCLISVGELAAGDVERADTVNITFAG